MYRFSPIFLVQSNSWIQTSCKKSTKKKSQQNGQITQYTSRKGDPIKSVKGTKNLQPIFRLAASVKYIQNRNSTMSSFLQKWVACRTILHGVPPRKALNYWLRLGTPPEKIWWTGSFKKAGLRFRTQNSYQMDVHPPTSMEHGIPMQLHSTSNRGLFHVQVDGDVLVQGSPAEAELGTRKATWKQARTWGLRKQTWCYDGNRMGSYYTYIYIYNMYIYIYCIYCNYVIHMYDIIHPTTNMEQNRVSGIDKRKNIQGKLAPNYHLRWTVGLKAKHGEFTQKHRTIKT